MDLKELLEKGVSNDRGCVEWVRAKAGNGYGVIRLNNPRRMKYVHRLSYELSRRKEIPVKKMVLHHCDNPSCFNPAHLFLGNQKINMGDCSEKMRHVFGERSNFSKLTERQVRQIRSEYDPSNGVFQRVLAKKYGICRSAISLILSKTNWRHL